MQFNKTINDEILEQRIRQHENLIFRIGARLTGRFITKSDDEYSIGLLALNEAIQSYNSDKGVEFEKFAAQIIRRRLIDFYRQNKLYQQNLPLDESFLSQRNLIDEVDIRLEIAEYEKLLKQFQITFAELVKVSPKHKDSRQKLVMLAKEIAEDEEIVRQFIRTKKLPLQSISERFKIKQKSIEKYRKYLVAIILIYWGKFTGLQAYLGWGGDS
ncbi:RNA polymerase sigma-I factor [Carboxydothermus islandicus]|uniref:RNA polymerase sigma factor SigI n=1 Tax=Carboxydothermus islandicus TaxID=661089 RepID=A0A1L8D1K6_9THEO|nr:RNA polymerase sigma factor SigI [Carboxydothermus islandicus]GAV25060.1 RNA polymerase sigma-I factor [Carboxydothermus islandicus]